MPLPVSARPFRPPPSIHSWTVMCALASSCRSRFRASLAIIVLQCPFDIDGVSVAPFDGVALVTVHRPHETSKRSQQAFRQASPGARRFCASSSARSVRTAR